MENPYIYLFVREDLSKPQQIVQAAHAVDELNKKLAPNEQTNYMVLCGVKNEMELWKIGEWLAERSIFHHMFYEPDCEASTAIATRPLIGEEREPFKRFDLMR